MKNPGDRVSYCSNTFGVRVIIALEAIGRCCELQKSLAGSLIDQIHTFHR
jgi:hypothetical protein